MTGPGGTLAAPGLARPRDSGEVAALLAESRRVAPVGGGTKLAWGAPGDAPDLLLSTEGLGAIVEHNAGDLTVILEAGVTLRGAQEQFAGVGQRLALDPPDGDGRATVGGILATADSGPLRHRYGAVRDLILGVRVALPDGTVARAGSNVIKNVAGYDLAKLMCGALGTLGVICEATLRLHPLPEQSITVWGSATDPGVLARAARLLAGRALELEALDLRWDGPAAGGCLLARAVGRAAASTAGTVAALMGEAGLEVDPVHEDDAELWAEQRARQRALPDGAVVRVSALPADLERVLGACESAVGRAALGLAWVRLDGEDAAGVERLRAALAPAPCVVLDAPEALRRAVDPWGVVEGPELDLLRRVKARFDPTGVCNPGRFAGGI
ncbi:MAG: glycolate oxidase binding subunit [Solirubrobacteraceae bacterium]|jgi:glycolate oxidase FAD binding subunit|nr:glycolate oxidase binding subunit [Solirubrobacteraceae bacterium]